MNYTQLAIEILDQITIEETNGMPVSLIKYITWLIWQNEYTIDFQIFELNWEESFWIVDDWTKKFNLLLPYDGLDSKHLLKEAEEAKVNDKCLLVEYLDASIKLAKNYLMDLDASTLDNINDKWYTIIVTR